MALLPCLAVAAGSSGPAAAGGKLDLRLKEVRAAAGIEGWWSYEPLDGAPPYRIEIRATPSGFYMFEGKKEGSGPVVLELDRAEEGALYRGEVLAGFDRCVPPGARFSLPAVSDTIEIEPVFPILSGFEPGPPGPCRQAARYFVVAAGRGEAVRLRPAADLGLAPPAAGAGTPQLDRASGSRAAPTPSASSDASAAGNITIGGATLEDGTRVSVLGSQQDVRGRLWHHVRVLAGGAPAETGSPEGDEPGGAGADAGVAGSPADSPPPQAAKAGKKTELPSGYLPAGSVVSRWLCTLTRSVQESSDPAPHSGGS
jgi:hypothetical protein